MSKTAIAREVPHNNKSDNSTYLITDGEQWINQKTGLPHFDSDGNVAQDTYCKRCDSEECQSPSEIKP